MLHKQIKLQLRSLFCTQESLKTPTLNNTDLTEKIQQAHEQVPFQMMISVSLFQATW